MITFALAEAQLLDIVSEMLGGDEREALVVLKAQDAKERVLVPSPIRAHPAAVSKSSYRLGVVEIEQWWWGP